MRTSEILDLVSGFEERFAVDEWTVDGLHVWPYIRITFALNQFYASNAGGNTNAVVARSVGARVRTLLKGSANFCYAYLTNLRKNAQTDRQADVVLVSDGVSFVELGGRWYERFCDPLISRFADRGVSSLLLTTGYGYRVPRFTPSVFLQPALDAALIRGSFGTAQPVISSSLSSEFPEYRSELDMRHLPVKAPSFGKILKVAAVIREMSRVYRKILLKTTPRVVFIVDYYNIRGFALNLACRELGIPSVDLQHGLQGGVHVAYSRWSKVPSTGFAVLPALFWCWTEEDVEAILRWNSNVAKWHRPVLGGNVWLSEWRSGRSSTAMHFDQVITSESPSEANSRNILVALQWGTSIEEDLGPLLEAVRNAPPEWKWWFRLHPAMLNERQNVKDLLLKNGIVNGGVDIATDVPLYALLRHMHVHVTQYSSSVIEAELFGVPSVVITQNGVELFGKQILSGWARPAFSATDILSAIASQLAHRSALLHLHPPAVIDPGSALDSICNIATISR